MSSTTDGSHLVWGITNEEVCEWTTKDQPIPHGYCKECDCCVGCGCCECVDESDDEKKKEIQDLKNENDRLKKENKRLEEEDDYGIGWSEGWIFNGCKWKWDGCGPMTQIPTGPPPQRYWDEEDDNRSMDEEEKLKEEQERTTTCSLCCVKIVREPHGNDNVHQSDDGECMLCENCIYEDYIADCSRCFYRFFSSGVRSYVELGWCDCGIVCYACLTDFEKGIINHPSGCGEGLDGFPCLVCGEMQEHNMTIVSKNASGEWIYKDTKGGKKI